MTAPTYPDHSGDGLLLFNYTCDELGVGLSCWFEHEPANLGARSRNGEQLEPDYPATWALWHVYLPNSDVDICPTMRSDLVEEIEGWVADQADKEADDREWNDGYDKFQDWKDSQ
jgi:hypothetical protein